MKAKLKEFSWNLGQVKIIIEDEKGQSHIVQGSYLTFSEILVLLNDQGEYEVSWTYRMGSE